jgi:hypothetical protein
LHDIAQGFSATPPSSFTFNPPPAQPAQPAPIAQPPTSQASQTPNTQSPVQSSPQSGTIALNDGTQLDAGVVKVMQAIKNVETQGSKDPYNAVGDNGSSLGAFQWNNDNKPLAPGQIPSHFVAAANQYGLDPTDFSPANQNKVAYQQILAYKNQGLTPNEIDALWNGAHKDPSTGQYVHNNPERLTKFNDALSQTVNNTNTPNDQVDTSQIATPGGPPSIGGFGSNVLSSGANFLGNLGNAALHPIQTIQGIGSAAVGGLQELGGQQNTNTAAFDNLASYFKNRYGSVQDLAHTAYTDPVGLAADLSSVLGVAGGAVGAAGKVADLADAGNAASKAASLGSDFVVGAGGTAVPAARSAVGAAADAFKGVSSGLNTASTLTNPLTPIISGASALIGDGAKLTSGVGSAFTGIPAKSLEDIYSHPESYTPDDIASVTRTTVGQQVESALQSKISALEDTSKSYAPVLSQDIAVPVSKNFLEDQLRTVAKVDIKDGQIIPTTVSKLSSSDLPKLQDILDTYKPAFQKGTLTPEELITLRQKLDSAAYGENGIKNSKVAGVAAQIRGNLNDAYRGDVSGLEELDNKFSSQLTELKELRKGFIDKDGNLTQSAISKIANAGNKDLELQRLEKIVPGITRKIEIMRTIEDIQKATANHGGFLGKIAEGGTMLSAAVHGNIPLMGGALAAVIVSSPKVAVPLLRVFGDNKALISTIVAHLSRYATIGAVANSTLSAQGTSTAQSTPDQTLNDQSTVTTPSQGTSQSSGTDQANVDPLTALASSKGFDLSAAQSAGYTPEEIQSYLNSLPQ